MRIRQSLRRIESLLPLWFSPFLSLLSFFFSPRLSAFWEAKEKVKVFWLKLPSSNEDYFRLVAPAEGERALVVGGRYGYCALQCSYKVGQRGEVIVVEPCPKSLHFLATLFRGKKNVVLVPKAAMDRKGEIQMYLGLSDVNLSAFDEGMPIRVCADTLDHICAELGVERVDYMAMDVEGAEVEALRGAKRILRCTEKVVVGAYHQRGGKPTWFWVERYLKKMGFKTKVTDDGLVHAWRTGTRSHAGSLI